MAASSHTVVFGLLHVSSRDVVFQPVAEISLRHQFWPQDERRPELSNYNR